MKLPRIGFHVGNELQHCYLRIQVPSCNQRPPFSNNIEKHGGVTGSKAWWQQALARMWRVESMRKKINKLRLEGGYIYTLI